MTVHKHAHMYKKKRKKHTWTVYLSISNAATECITRQWVYGKEVIFEPFTLTVNIQVKNKSLHFRHSAWDQLQWLMLVVTRKKRSFCLLKNCTLRPERCPRFNISWHCRKTSGFSPTGQGDDLNTTHSGTEKHGSWLQTQQQRGH